MTRFTAPQLSQKLPALLLAARRAAWPRTQAEASFERAGTWPRDVKNGDDHFSVDGQQISFSDKEDFTQAPPAHALAHASSTRTSTRLRHTHQHLHTLPALAQCHRCASTAYERRRRLARTGRLEGHGCADCDRLHGKVSHCAAAQLDPPPELGAPPPLRPATQTAPLYSSSR